MMKHFHLFLLIDLQVLRCTVHDLTVVVKYLPEHQSACMYTYVTNVTEALFKLQILLDHKKVSAEKDWV